MPENLDSSDLREEDFHNPGVGYEHSQADLRVVHGFLIGLALNIALVLVVLWGMYRYLATEEGQRSNAPAPVTYSTPPKIPQPNLQPDPVADDNYMRLEIQQRLNSYGWVDQKSGIAHIPINRAMDLLLQRGIPAVNAPNPNPSVGPYPGAARLQQDVSKE